MRLLNYGRRGLLVELDSLDAALRLSADLNRHRPPGVTELVPGAQTVLIEFDPDRTSSTGLAAELADRCRVPRRGGNEDDEPGLAGDEQFGTVEIPVVYDGPDLDEVARLTGLSVADLIERHCSAEYLVAFTGFAPGFGYLSGGDPALAVPRRSTPRTRVEAGAVGLAGEFTGVYPRPGPGGWQIIGHTETVTWNLDRMPPALLRPGIRVLFRAVTS